MKLGGVLNTEFWDAIDLTSRAANGVRVSAAIRAINDRLTQARNDGDDYVTYSARLGAGDERESLTRADVMRVAELLVDAGWFVAVSRKPALLFWGGKAFILRISRRPYLWLDRLRLWPDHFDYFKPTARAEENQCRSGSTKLPTTTS